MTVFIPDLHQALPITDKGMVSRVLQDDDRVKVVLYSFAAGHQMKLHAAPVPAMLYLVEGEAILTLGDESMPVGMGAFAHMPANLKHAIVANTRTLLLLVIVKIAH